MKCWQHEKHATHAKSRWMKRKRSIMHQTFWSWSTVLSICCGFKLFHVLIQINERHSLNRIGCWVCFRETLWKHRKLLWHNLTVETTSTGFPLHASEPFGASNVSGSLLDVSLQVIMLKVHVISTTDCAWMLPWRNKTKGLLVLVHLCHGLFWSLVCM